MTTSDVEEIVEPSDIEEIRENFSDLIDLTKIVITACKTDTLKEKMKTVSETFESFTPSEVDEFMQIMSESGEAVEMMMQEKDKERMNVHAAVNQQEDE